jgi:HPt (histidine-containing phosphotransfer) domain-containing protein
MDFKYINTEYLDSVSGGDPAIVKELVNLFKEQVVEFSFEMNSLFQGKNYQSLGMLAHKAKSSVAIMGMNELAQLLKNFELEAKEGKNPEKYETYINRFSHDTRMAVGELEDLIRKMQ